MFIRFDTLLQCFSWIDRQQTLRQTDGRNCYINIVLCITSLAGAW